MRSHALRHLTIIALAGLLLLPFGVSLQAHERNRGRGPVIIVPRYSYYYPYRTYGWGLGWGWGNPYWDSGPYYQETKGKIKLKDYIKSDQVYIDGAYAGTADRMKTIKVDPGRYRIQIHRQGTEVFNKSIYVVAGKTVEIDVNGS